MGRPFMCPYCGNTQSTSKGVRHTKTIGTRHIRRCKGCRRRFTPKHQKTEPDQPQTAVPASTVAPEAETVVAALQPQPIVPPESSGPGEAPG